MRKGPEYNDMTLFKCCHCGKWSKWEGYCSMVCLVDHGANVTGSFARKLNDNLHAQLKEVLGGGE